MFAVDKHRIKVAWSDRQVKRGLIQPDGSDRQKVRLVCLTEPAASASTARAHIHAERFLALLAQAGRPLASGACVLDFGCGQGALVDALAARGFDAWGCDLSCGLGETTDRVRRIPDVYRIPFEDGRFDCVLSDQVFEHVQHYSAALAEIRRVLRPGAVGLHIFSPRYEPIEPHTFVPLANIVQTKWWLRLWAALGVRNRFQRGMISSEVAELNYRFCRRRRPTTLAGGCFERRVACSHAPACWMSRC